MSLLDTLLSQAGTSTDVSGIASKFGIDPATATQAIAALGAAHGQTGGDPQQTVDTAAASSGLDPSMLSGIAGELGGVPALGQLSSAMQSHPEMVSMASQFIAKEGGTGGLMGMVSSFFGKSGS